MGQYGFSRAAARVTEEIEREKIELLTPTHLEASFQWIRQQHGDARLGFLLQWYSLVSEPERKILLNFVGWCTHIRKTENPTFKKWVKSASFKLQRPVLVDELHRALLRAGCQEIPDSPGLDPAEYVFKEIHDRLVRIKVGLPDTQSRARIDFELETWRSDLKKRPTTAKNLTFPEITRHLDAIRSGVITEQEILSDEHTKGVLEIPVIANVAREEALHQVPIEVVATSILQPTPIERIEKTIAQQEHELNQKKMTLPPAPPVGIGLDIIHKYFTQTFEALHDATTLAKDIHDKTADFIDEVTRATGDLKNTIAEARDIISELHGLLAQPPHTTTEKPLRSSGKEKKEKHQPTPTRLPYSSEVNEENLDTTLNLLPSWFLFGHIGTRKFWQADTLIKRNVFPSNLSLIDAVERGTYREIVSAWEKEHQSILNYKAVTAVENRIRALPIWMTPQKRDPQRLLGYVKAILQ